RRRRNIWRRCVSAGPTNPGAACPESRCPPELGGEGLCQRVLYSSCILAETNAGELPASRRWEEIPVGRADVALWRRRRTAAQNHLTAHELAVVFGRDALERTEAGIGIIGRARPLPGIAI